MPYEICICIIWMKNVRIGVKKEPMSKWKRRLLALLTAAALLLSLGAGSALAVSRDYPSLRVYVDGLLTARAYTKDGEVYLSPADICACLGLETEESYEPRSQRTAIRGQNLVFDAENGYPYLSVNGRALFEDLLDNDSHPIVAAVTFMALLEMIKTDEVVFRQSELFGPIWIYRKKNNPDYAEEMARETVFFSKDPEVKPGLVEALRSQALARSQQGNVGDIAAVMREAVLWTSRGRNVTEDDLTAMLEGREDISEVQENPFGDSDDDEQGTATPVQDAAVTGPTHQAATDTVAEQPAANAEATAETATDETTTAADESATPSEMPEEAPADFPVEASASDAAAELEEEAFEETAEEASAEESTAEPVAEQAPETSEVTPEDKPAAETPMTDEEIEAFIKKAQAYYAGEQPADET